MSKVNPAEIHAQGVINNAGGPSYTIDKWDRLERYLIIGSEGGTFYVNETRHTKQNTDNVLACVKEDGVRAVTRAIEISNEGLAPKNDQAIFVIALGMAEGDLATKAFAREHLKDIVRTASHLTMFVNYVSSLRGWGKALRKAVVNWYRTIGARSKDDEDGNLSALVYQMMKYSNRNGYTQRDILRLSHVKPTNPAQSTLFNWIAHPDIIPDVADLDIAEKVIAVNEELYKYAAAKQLGNFDLDKIIDLLIKYRLPHEVIPTELKNEPRIWQALLDAGMPINALIRNLGKLSQIGLLTPMSANVKKVCETFRNEDIIRKARIHPITVLNQKCGYERGRGMSGITWDPNSKVCEALEDMFYMSFKNVVPTGKNIMLALDVSGSMSSLAPGTNLTCAQVTAAMSMTTVRSEANSEIFAFSDHFMNIPINKNTSLNEAMRLVSDRNFGGTDCGLPMKYAKDNHMEVDSFVIYTDNETWCGGRLTPAKLLREYRAKMNRPEAKLAVVACASTEFTIADPDDPNMLDIAGFSSAVPQILSYFISK